MRREREHFLSSGFVFSHNEKSASCKTNLWRNSSEVFPTLILLKAQPESRKGRPGGNLKSSSASLLSSESCRVPQNKDMSCMKHPGTSREVMLAYWMILSQCTVCSPCTFEGIIQKPWLLKQSDARKVTVLFTASFSVTTWHKMFLMHLCALWDQQTGFISVYMHDTLFFVGWLLSFLHTPVFLLWISAWCGFLPYVVCLNKAHSVKKGTGSTSCLLGLCTPQLQCKLCNHLLILNVLSLAVRCAWRWMCVLEGSSSVWRSGEVSSISRSWHDDRGGRNDIAVWRERKRRPGDFHGTCSAAWWCWKRPGVWRWGGRVCVRGLVLSGKAASCSLLSGSQPGAGGSEVALRQEDGKSGGRRRAGRSLSAPQLAGILPAFLLGATCWGSSSGSGYNSRSIPGWRGDHWEHQPGKGKGWQKAGGGRTPQAGLNVLLRQFWVYVEAEPRRAAAPWLC